MEIKPAVVLKIWKPLRQVAEAGWELGSLDVDFNEFLDDLEEIRRDPRGCGLDPEDFSLESFEGQNIEDFLEPAGFIYAYYSFMEDGRTTGESISMRVELLPGGTIKRCLVRESGRKVWLDLGREVPTPEQALWLFRIKYPKRRAA